MISNLMVHMRGLHAELNENMLRHMILNSIRMNKKKFEGKYGELVIACDDKNYWRKKYFPYYKANRKKNRDESTLDWNTIFVSLNKIREELKEYFPYRVIQIESAEADDIIGTLCMAYGRPLGGDPILILSGDKDFVQLQQYTNVSQYDPIRKRVIKSPNPREYLYEHIIRGDTGDGIPNFLSEDDIFISEGRQRRITSKRLKGWMSQLLTGVDPIEIFDDEQLRNWNRNESLIDLTKIPANIREQVLAEFDAQETKPSKDLFTYFIKHRLKNLTESIGDFK